MTTSARALVMCTGVCLVLVTAYTVALGSSGLLWFVWVLLGLSATGMYLAHGPR